MCILRQFCVHDFIGVGSYSMSTCCETSASHPVFKHRLQIGEFSSVIIMITWCMTKNKNIIYQFTTSSVLLFNLLLVLYIIMFVVDWPSVASVSFFMNMWNCKIFRSVNFYFLSLLFESMHILVQACIQHFPCVWHSLWCKMSFDFNYLKASGIESIKL